MERTELEGRLAQEHAAAFGWALHCCRGSYEEALDVLQSVYLAVLEGRAKFGGRSSFRTWLFSVIRRAAWKRRWLNLRFLRWAQDGAPPEAACGPAAEGTVYRQELRERILSLLARLSPRQRELLHLVFYQDLTIEEAAEVLGISVGSARTHYERGKLRLLEEIRASGIEHEYAQGRLGDQTAL